MVVAAAVVTAMAAQGRKLDPSALVVSEPGSMQLEGPRFRCATDPQASGILPTSCSLRRPMQELHQVAVNETRVL